MNEIARLNPRDHPAGTRALCCENWVRDSLYEITVLEWSPQGNVQIKYVDGGQPWIKSDKIPECVEILPRRARKGKS